MSEFRMIKFEDLLKELDEHTFKQLHIHHTWKPTHKNFNGVNHFNIQTSMYNYHTKTLGWGNIGQHLTLFPDGKWLTGRPFGSTPASIKGWNTGALAVEMVGNFDTPGTGSYNDSGYDKLEGRQKEEILRLIKYFIDKYGEDSVVFHRDNPTAGKTCPGTSLDKDTMIKEAKTMNAQKEVEVKVDTPSPWAKEAWDWAIKNGITDGTRPKDNATREEIITMLYRTKGVK
ncbi:MAG: N-acetylmuramoyl-L-alanine amidase [Tissierellaceae bacterium]|nr:N-acetylmuramoyl-L-alanine amidase [Tissierellaceae bacterium]